MRRLEGKTVVITGGGGGIGRASALRFVEEGARLALIDKDADLGKETIRLIDEDKRNRVIFFQTDLTKSEEVKNLVERIYNTFEVIDVLFNIAGMSGRQFGDGPIHECTEEGWDKTLEVNAKTMFLMNKYVTAKWLETGRKGNIINLASVLGIVGGGKYFATHAYAASKAAIIGMSKAMAIEYADRGIRINVIAPGLIRTPMSRRAQSNQEIIDFIKLQQPITQGLIEPIEVANTAVFLASEEASSITGIVLPVDGGWMAQ